MSTSENDLCVLYSHLKYIRLSLAKFPERFGLADVYAPVQNHELPSAASVSVLKKLQFLFSSDKHGVAPHLSNRDLVNRDLILYTVSPRKSRAFLFLRHSQIIKMLACILCHIIAQSHCVCVLCRHNAIVFLFRIV